MTVATRNQPDVTGDTPSEYKANIDASLQVDGEVAGQFAPHETSTPAMTVTVDAGRLMYAGTLATQTAQTTGTITAPSTNPRIDRVVIDETDGSISVVTGSEAASPSAPAIPAGYLPCCQVALATSTTTITNSLITDERSWLVTHNALVADSLTARTTNGNLNFPRNGTGGVTVDSVPIYGMVILNAPEILIDTTTTFPTTATAVNSTTLNTAEAKKAILRIYVDCVNTAAGSLVQVAIGPDNTVNRVNKEDLVIAEGRAINETLYDVSEITVNLDGNYDFWYDTLFTGTTRRLVITLVGYYA